MLIVKGSAETCNRFSQEYSVALIKHVGGEGGGPEKVSLGQLNAVRQPSEADKRAARAPE